MPLQPDDEITFEVIEDGTDSPYDDDTDTAQDDGSDSDA
jgi:hypothetical protein